MSFTAGRGAPDADLAACRVSNRRTWRRKCKPNSKKPYPAGRLATRWSRPGQPGLGSTAILSVAGRAAQLEAVKRRIPMPSYYSEKLSAERLKLCYDLGPPAVRRYLAAEIEYVRERSALSKRVLELGCGFGRVLKQLSRAHTLLVGIDTSLQNLAMARGYLEGHGNITLLLMDAVRLGFPSNVFELVCCVQNGISAFHVDQHELFREAVRVAKPGGRVLFSSYADEFWENRLDWFRIQSSHGLIGEIDETRTADGIIVTKDGFTATTVTSERFMDLTEGLGTSRSVRVVAGSSIFCEILV